MADLIAVLQRFEVKGGTHGGTQEVIQGGPGGAPLGAPGGAQGGGAQVGEAQGGDGGERRRREDRRRAARRGAASRDHPSPRDDTHRDDVTHDVLPLNVTLGSSHVVMPYDSQQSLRRDYDATFDLTHDTTFDLTHDTESYSRRDTSHDLRRHSTFDPYRNVTRKAGGRRGKASQPPQILNDAPPLRGFTLGLPREILLGADSSPHSTRIQNPPQRAAVERGTRRDDVTLGDWSRDAAASRDARRDGIERDNRRRLRQLN